MSDLAQPRLWSRARLAARVPGLRGPAIALGLALAVSAALVVGAFGSPAQVATGLTKSAPYLLCSAGIALCFRANVINIGGEGQIALGGLAATAAALAAPADAPPVLVLTLALGAGALAGCAWGALAAALHLARRVHEVLVTLLLNFVALLMIGEALHAGLGEAGAGFPQSPLLPRAAWLPRFMPPTTLNLGIVVAALVAVGLGVLLWRTTFGFAIRATGASRKAADYAGFSAPRVVFGVMALAGASAGLAGAVQVLGVQHRLIEGYSNGYGFVSVAVALLGGLDPLAMIPASLFFAFLETGMAAMQRQVGVPSSLISVIEGIVMLSVLAAKAAGARRAKV